MPDISKCIGTDCPLKENCYRYLSHPTSDWQSWLAVVPWNKITKSCSQYMPED